MRFKGFMRRIIGSGEIEAFGFGLEHFKAAGLAPTPAAGMPVLEAYQLVNQWNKQQTNPRFIYCLE